MGAAHLPARRLLSCVVLVCVFSNTEPTLSPSNAYPHPPVAGAGWAQGPAGISNIVIQITAACSSIRIEEHKDDSTQMERCAGQEVASMRCWF
jgi:hypothetical protein